MAGRAGRSDGYALPTRPLNLSLWPLADVFLRYKELKKQIKSLPAAKAEGEAAERAARAETVRADVR
jgi:hypothetical protein